MSYETWKAVHYPVSASDPSLDTESKRLVHSLIKWRGLRDDKLDAHGLVRNGYMLKTKDGERYVADINSESCALCVAYTCDECPISRSRGDVACDERTEGECVPGGDSPWYALHTPGTAGVEPMIKALEEAGRYIDAQYQDEEIPE